MKIDKYSRNIIMSAGEFEDEKNYWTDKLQGDFVLGSVPSSFTNLKKTQNQKECKSCILPHEVCQKLLSISGGSTYALYMMLLSCVNYLIYRYTGTDDIILGMPEFKTEATATKPTNILPVRVNVKNTETFKDLLIKVKNVISEADKNKNLPMEIFAELLGYELCEIPSIFKTIVMLENVHDKSCVEGMEPDTLFNFSMNRESIRIDFEYNSDMYTEQFAQGVLSHIVNVISSISSNPNIILSGLEILSEGEKKKILYDFNDTQKSYNTNRTMHELFELQVEKTPDNIATVFEGKGITYRELNFRANRLAELLKDRGVKQGVFAGVLMERSSDMIIAVMGILKAGGIYVPFEPSFPRNRIVKIFSDLKIQCIITQKQQARMVCEMQWELPLLTDVVYMDVEDEKLPMEQLDQKSVKSLWDHVAQSSVDDVTAGGFVSSYTGKPFSKEEVGQYANHVLELAAPYMGKEKKAVDLGCGSGTIMFSAAALVNEYVGIDPSELTQKHNEEYISKGGFTNIKLLNKFAHEVDSIEENNCDLIIMSSIVQFFPGFIYLEKVIEKALKILKPGGTIIIADVMDARKKADFRKSLEEFKSKCVGQEGIKTKTDIDGELYIDEQLFNEISERNSEIQKIQVLHREDKFNNELNYRYDVIISKASNNEKNNTNIKINKNNWTLWHMDNYSGENPENNVKSEDLAYVIYTSGSTGVPKGVAVRHKPVINLIEWVNGTFNIGPHDKLLFVTSLCFDLSVYDIFGILASGGTIRVATRSELTEPKLLAEILRKEPITFWDSAPAALQQITPFLDKAQSENDNSKLRLVFQSGDWIPVTLPDKVRAAFPKAKVISLGGATEATVWSNYYPIEEVDTKWASIPYGKPIQNALYYILDSNLQPCPVGVTGDLYIGGECLAAEYINDKKLTDKKFITDPFNKQMGGRMYKTGDTARWFEDGNMEFMGRKDFQVKVRGYRIELGEIESRLLKHENVKDAVAIVRKDDDGNNYICAYIVSETDFNVSDFREYLSRELPTYMIPSFFIKIPAMPITNSGKLDRSKLPEPFGNVTTSVKYVAPKSEPEKKLVKIYEDILKVEKVGINDDFFELGGDSIKAIQVVSSAEQQEINISVSDVLKYKTIDEILNNVDYTKKKQVVSQEDVIGELPLTPIQEWFFEKDRGYMHHWNLSNLFRVNKDVDPVLLENVLKKIIEHHDALRMGYTISADNIVQYNRSVDDVNFSLENIDLSQYSYDVQKKHIRDLCCKIQGSFELQENLLVKACLFELGENGKRLFLAVHHLVIDGVSWRILIEDIQKLYKSQLQEELALKTTSFKEWSTEINKYSTKTTLDIEYWERLDTSRIKTITSKKIEENYLKDHKKLSFVLDAEQTKELVAEANRAYGTEINDVLLTALTMSLGDVFGIDNVLVMLESYGREEIFEGINLTRTIGWFTSIYPVLLEKQNNIEGTIKEVKKSLRNISSKSINYGIARYLNKNEKLKMLKPQISFNYLGQFDNPGKEDDSIISGCDEEFGQNINENNIHDYLMDFNGIMADGKLQFVIGYNQKYIDEDIAQKTAEYFERSLMEISKHCKSKLKEISEVKNAKLYQLNEAGAKELKVVVHNDIVTYLCHSLPICVILADERLLPWYYEHYINLFTEVQSNGGLIMEFLEVRAPYNEVIQEVYMGYELLKNIPDIIDYVIDKINMGYYVIIHMDEFYLPEKMAYKKQHFVHHSLVYGYDNSKNKLKAIGFNSDQMFAEITFDYDLFREAYESGKLHYKSSAPWAETNAIELLKLRDFKQDYPFSIKRFTSKLEAYVNSTEDLHVIYAHRFDKYVLENDKIKYGIDVYDEIIRHLYELMEGKISIDYRTIHLLYEHKKSVYMRLQYVISHYDVSVRLKELLDEYKKIFDTVDSARLIFLKETFVKGNSFNLIPEKGNIAQMISILKPVKEMERLVLTDICEQLKL